MLITQLLMLTKKNLRSRTTGSNMGQADVSEIYSIFGVSLLAELQELLQNLIIDAYFSDRTANIIPCFWKS